MQLVRPALLVTSRRFGRGRTWADCAPPAPPPFALADELKLFATTFAGGFLFVSLLIA